MLFTLEERLIMNKSTLLKKAKAILNDNPIGTVFDNTSEDYRFLLRIFQGHPEYHIKVGSGIANVYTGKGETYNTRCFFLTRVDGSSSDISYIRSINGATTKISDIKCACRSAIDDIIIQFKSSVRFGFDTCPISGHILYTQNTHIDHYDKKFDELFQIWIKSKNIDSTHQLLNDTTKDHEQKIYFVSRSIREDFIAFHNANTNLRAVTKEANLSTLKRKKPIKI